MENTTNDWWLTLLNSAHYLLLAAILILLIVFIVRLFKVRQDASSHGESAMKSHQRSHKHTKNA